MAKEKEIGALWVTEGRKGNYLKGFVEINGEKHQIVCFVNGYKTEAKHPDYRVLASTPQNGAGYQEAEQRSADELLAPTDGIDAEPADDVANIGF